MLTCQKHLFSLPDDVHYLNCATMAPNMKSVEAAAIQGVLRKSRPFELTQESWFEEKPTLKRLFTELIQGADSERVALIPAVSYGMSTVAKNVGKKKKELRGREILLIQDEFPSDVYPWEELCADEGFRIKTVAPPEGTTDRGKRWNGRVLEAINADTALVVLPHCHWTDGTRFDLAAISKRAKEAGALFAVDGTQSVGAHPINIQEIEPDALICAGYKTMMGPYSLGLAWYGEFFDDGTPIEENWINREGSQNFRTLTQYRERRAKGFRYSVGEASNFILVPALIKALEQLLAWMPEAVQEYTGALIAEPLRVLQEKGYWVEHSDWRGNHLFGLTALPGVDIAALQQKLIERKIYVSLRGNSIRVAPSVYNDANDMDAFVDALMK